jgi:hypothetical protein
MIFEKKSQPPNDSLSFTYPHTQKSTKFEHQEKNDDEDRYEMDVAYVWEMEKREQTRLLFLTPLNFEITDDYC